MTVTLPAPVRIMIVDDHRVFAQALAARLGIEPGFRASAVTGIEQARAALAGTAVSGRPDVLLLDMDLGTGDGIGFARRIRAELPTIKILMLAVGHGTRVAEAVRCGVSGWIPKGASARQLIAAIRGALDGETWIPPRLLTGVLNDLLGGEQDRMRQHTSISALTARETEILRCMVAGLSRAAIADRLFLSPHTVRTHAQNILAKLAVHSTVAAVALARHVGLPPIDD
jgi:DNA-binding NarL/FixJ family response regulator